MFIAAFPAGPWATNCYVVAPEDGAECVIIDPGMGAAEQVAAVVAEHKLKPVSVLITHGHLDHTWSVAPVAGTYDATAYVHSDDRNLLADPAAAMGAETAAMLQAQNLSFAEPDDVKELADGDLINLAGIDFTIDHVPGHTPGSITFQMPYADSTNTIGDISGVMFSGDLLFQGSIGRTDLPGGNHADMLESLRTKVLPLDDRIVVLPGHGEQTTIGRERATNPYLTGLE